MCYLFLVSIMLLEAVDLTTGIHIGVQMDPKTVLPSICHALLSPEMMLVHASLVVSGIEACRPAL
jgi:hypothetical protein